MSAFQRVLLKTQTPILLAKRFRGKINIQKPRPPHFEKQLLLDLTQPVFRPPKTQRTELSLCEDLTKRERKQIDNPFERILANECLNWFNTSKMVIFVHKNSISMEDKMPLFASLRKNDMHLRNYGKKIVGMATNGTRYEAVNQLFVSQQDIIFGQPDKLNTLLKLLKKTPQMIILAGIVEDRFMSKNELLEFSKLPNLDVARSQLCSVLDSAGSCLVQQLQQSQQTLVAHLDQHVDLLKNSATQPHTEQPHTEETPNETQK